MSGQVVSMEAAHTVNLESKFVLDTMVYGFWAWGEVEMKSMQNSLGKFRMNYHISFTGHPSEEPDFFEVVVPLIVKTWKYKGL